MRAAHAPAMLACRCGAGMLPCDMRRLPPLGEPDTAEGVVLDRIVCPACAAEREQEITALAASPTAADTAADTSMDSTRPEIAEVPS